jgi:hypothetical protein
MRCEKRRRERGCGVEKGIGLSGERTTNRASASLEQREREREHAAYLYRRASGHRRQGVPARVPGATSTPAPRAGLLLRPILTWPNDCGSLVGGDHVAGGPPRSVREGRARRIGARDRAWSRDDVARAPTPRSHPLPRPPPPPSTGRNPRLELTRASSPPTRAARRARDRDPRRLEVHGRERGPGQG